MERGGEKDDNKSSRHLNSRFFRSSDFLHPPGNTEKPPKTVPGEQRFLEACVNRRIYMWREKRIAKRTILSLFLPVSVMARACHTSRCTRIICDILIYARRTASCHVCLNQRVSSVCLYACVRRRVCVYIFYFIKAPVSRTINLPSGRGSPRCKT